jgi:hypothetical protein
MRSHTQSVVIEPNRRRITGCISYKPLIVTDISVLIVCNKTGGTIKGDIKKYRSVLVTCRTHEGQGVAKMDPPPPPNPLQKP